MKVVHLCLACFFPDGFSYQENLLPKYHKDLGYDVEVIASLESFNKEGKFIILEPCKPYINEYGIKVTRLEYKYNNKFAKKIKIYKNTYNTIRNAKPDILFIHGLQFWDMHEVVRYLKEHRNVSVFVDNHADYLNSATNWLSKNILHKIIWKYCAKEIEPYTVRFYGVLPARVDFLKDVYGVTDKKCELLVMGADDEFVEKAIPTFDSIRDRYMISSEDFLIVTGGKINATKTETLDLMAAVAESNFEKIKLIIFGSVDDSLRPRFDLLCKNERIQFVGWQDAQNTYCLMNAANIIVFPGLHSVMWEQAVALGKPCIFRDLDGFHHVDLGGNAIFLKDVSIESLKNTIEKLYLNPEQYEKMKKIATTKGMKYFSYKDISTRSINK